MNKDRISYLGQELNIDDNVQFTSSKMTLIGKIIGFENDKAIIQTRGCKYSNEDELEMIRQKAKRQYKLKCKNLIYVTTKKVA